MLSGILTDAGTLWSLGLFGVLAVGLIFHKTVGRLIKIVLRTVLGAGALAVIAQYGALVGIHLGLNIYNALVIGVLGMPGLGLLLMLSWMTK